MGAWGSGPFDNAGDWVFTVDADSEWVELWADADALAEATGHLDTIAGVLRAD